MNTFNKYVYIGPVKSFDDCICDRWEGTTYAISEKRARSNLAYQYKMKNGHSLDSNIHLPGKIIKE